MGEAAVYKSFGRAVATRRRHTKLSQAEVAERIGMSRASLANIEAGRQRVFLHQVLALAGALGLESAHEIVPAKSIGSSEDFSGRTMVTSVGRFTSQQRIQIDKVVNSMAADIFKDK